MSSVSEIGRLGCALRDLCDAAPDGDAVGLANIGKSEKHRHDDIQGLLRFEPHRKPFDEGLGRQGGNKVRRGDEPSDPRHAGADHPGSTISRPRAPDKYQFRQIAFISA
jgi:hypothetical protein